MFLKLLFVLITAFVSGFSRSLDYADDYVDFRREITYKQFSAPDGHRCGICPTYFQKICGFDTVTNSTYIFDNHCVMDLYNCKENRLFSPINYDHCLYFGNFAFVHGFKYEDEDYEDRHIDIKHSKKNRIR